MRNPLAPRLIEIALDMDRLGRGEGLEQVPEPEDRLEVLQANFRWYSRRLYHEAVGQLLEVSP